MVKKFWDWMRTEKKVIKPALGPYSSLLNKGSDFYMPLYDPVPKMVSEYSERELQEMYPPLKDAHEQYQILLTMYNNKHKSKFKKARSV